LQDWAAVTLNRDYPGLAAAEHGGPVTAAQLIRTGRVALFLDGLDEMALDVRGAALQQCHLA
jgi:predicted NACHT family NTPase